MIQVSLKQWLFGQTGLTDELGTRIYPLGSVPEPTIEPYLVWQLIDRPHVHNQAGASGLANPRIQFDIWGESEYDAARIMDILISLLDTFRGTMGDPDETTVRLVAIDTDGELYTPPTDSRQMGAFRSTADFMFWNVEG